VNSIAAVLGEQESVIDADTALTELYAGHYARLVRLAVLLLRDQGLAEDVVQDSFVAVHGRWGRIDQANAPAYLRQTVVNPVDAAADLELVAMIDVGDPLPDAAGADDAVLRRERRDAVLDALALLPTRQREVLVLRHYLDLTEREIAITPVEATSACPPHASRASAAIWRASRMPPGPVHALALPLLTTTPRIRPRVRARIERDSTTGAATTWFLVNTAAALTGPSAAIRPTSRRWSSLIPAATPANRNPEHTRFVTRRSLPDRTPPIVSSCRHRSRSLLRHRHAAGDAERRDLVR